MSLSLHEKLILGTVQMGLDYGINNTSGKPTMEQSFSILEAAHKGGITRLDTAEAYGNSQEVIGMFHKNSPLRFRVITKYSSKTLSPGSSFEEHVKKSMATLNVSSLEAYMFHSFADYQANTTALSALKGLRKEGLISKVGVSVYSNQEAETVLRDNPGVNLIQLPFNLLDNNVQRGAVLRRAKDLGVEIHARSLFLQGLFMKKRSTLEPPLTTLLPYLRTVDTIASESNKPIEAIALNYGLQNELIDGVLFGVDTLAQLEENIGYVSGFGLSKEELNAIDNIRVLETELLSPVNWQQTVSK